LSRRPEPEQDTVIAGLLRRLWIEPARDHPFRPLQLMCQQWADGFERKAESGALARPCHAAGAVLDKDP